MKQIPWLCLVAVLCLGFMPLGCTSSIEPDGDSQTDTQTTEEEQTDDPSATVDPVENPDDAAASVGPFDGTYTVTFISNGIQVALGTLEITNSRFAGDLVSIYSEVFWIEGYLDNDGNFIFEPIEGNQGSIVVAEGQISEGLVSGIFDIDDGERGGIFSGSRGSSPFDLNPVTDFDGSYEISLEYLSAEVGTTVFNIENGKFDAIITTLEDATFELSGFVTSDGTVVVSMLAGTSNIDELLAEGSIDHETLEIAGMYRIGSFAGTISGRASD